MSVHCPAIPFPFPPDFNAECSYDGVYSNWFATVYTGPRLAYVSALLSEDQYTICLTFYSVHCLEIGFIILLCFSFSYFHHYFIRRMRVLVYWLLIFCCILTSRCTRISLNSGFVSTPAMLNQTNRSKPRRRPKLCLRIEVETQKKVVWHLAARPSSNDRDLD